MKEEEIRPKKVFDEYLRLAALDAVVYLANSSRQPVPSVETPGKLDMDILFNNRMLVKDRFWRNFVAQASPEERQEWQQFIASHGFSSQMFVVCECPEK